MFRNVVARIAMVSGALALISAPAVGSQKVLGGGICYQTNAPTGTASYDTRGAIGNSSSTGELEIDCPILRENPNVNIAAGQISWDVFDRNATRDVTCYFINEIGTTTGWGAANVVSATSTGTNQVGVKNIWTSATSNTLGAATFSHVRCSIPRTDVSGSSHLARIWVSEP
jgi:hypothetical protein